MKVLLLLLALAGPAHAFNFDSAPWNVPMYYSVNPQCSPGCGATMSLYRSSINGPIYYGVTWCDRTGAHHGGAVNFDDSAGRVNLNWRAEFCQP